MMEIQSRDELAAFIDALAEDRRQNPEAWENLGLAGFLEALGAWVRDMDGYFANRGEETPALPSWRLFGMMLLAARVYE